MLKKNFILSYSSQLLSSIIGISLSLWTARICGPSIMGTIAYGTAYASMFKFILDLGLSNALIKLYNENSNFNLKNIATTFTVLKIFSIILYSLIAFLVILNTKFSSNEHRVVLILWFFIVLFDGIAYIPLSFFIAKTKRVLVDIPLLFQNVGIKLTRLILAIMGFGAIALSKANLVFTFLLLPVLFFWLFKQEIFGKFEKKIAIKLFQYSVPLLIYSFVSSFYDSIDRVMIEKYSDIKQIGLYSIGFSFAIPIQAIGTAISGLLFPTFSLHVSNNNFPKIEEILITYERFMIIFVLPLMILLASASPFYIPILVGDKYLGAEIPVAIIVIALFVKTLFFPTGNLVFGLGKFVSGGLILGINLIILVSILFIFISPDFLNLGSIGASLSLFLSFIILYYSTFLYLKKILKDTIILNGLRKYLAQIIFQVIFGAIIFYFYFNSINIGGIILSIVFVFMSVLLIWKKIDNNDKLLFSSIIKKIKLRKNI